MGFTEGGYGTRGHDFAALHDAKKDAPSFEAFYPTVDPIKASRLLFEPDFIAIASLREMGHRSYMPSGLQDLYHDAVGPSLNALEDRLRKTGYTNGEIWSCLAAARGEVDFPEVVEDVIASDPEIIERLNRAYEQNVPQMMIEEEEAGEAISREFRAELEGNRLKYQQSTLGSKPRKRHFQVVADIIQRLKRKKNQDGT